MQQQRFQVDLRGLITLLSDHLYSTPQVFVRELLQNGIDAITARRKLEPAHQGSVTVELVAQDHGAAPALIVQDDGIGLEEAQVHELLATIGQSSKRGVPERDGESYIGQFGIGLLSCFVVAEEILVRSRALSGAPGVEWLGRQDGTYSVRTLSDAGPVGTSVYLRARKGSEELFEPERLRELLVHYGGLLPHPVRFASGGHTQLINEVPPWLAKHGSHSEARAAWLAYGQAVFGQPFLDVIPLRADAGKVSGLAFVLSTTPSPAARRVHRVYLKRMLLSEQAEGLLPDWAFFVRCVINADALRPTASRETFYDDELLEQTRDELGAALRNWLMRLATEDPERLRRLVQVHGLSIKALALHEDEMLRLFAPFLPFETTFGAMTLADYLREQRVVRYVASLDEFRQVARVARAQGLCVINGGYVYDAELLASLPRAYADVQVERVDPGELSQSFGDLSVDEREAVHGFLQRARKQLAPHSVSVDIKHFRPSDVPAVYGAGEKALGGRDLERAKQAASDLWSSMLDDLSGGVDPDQASLCLNIDCPLVARLIELDHDELEALALETLYVQTLLMAQQPLSARELDVLNRGLLGLIEHAVSKRYDA